MSRIIKNMCKNMRALARAREGMAFLEFAITAPFLLALFLGSVEITRYIIVSQKVEKASVTVTDLVAQSSELTQDQLDQLILAAGEIMDPFEFGGATAYVLVSSVSKTGTNPPVVNWQYAGGGTWVQASHIGVTGGNATLPEGFEMNDRENVIVTEVYYNFTPLISDAVIDSGQIYKISFFKPRLGDLTTLGS